MFIIFIINIWLILCNIIINYYFIIINVCIFLYKLCDCKNWVKFIQFNLIKCDVLKYWYEER